ncbi:OmpA family protein [Pseudomonas typographi]|uniref:OmpA family protein n=1 Tax=Pseudomonas typographi TaxID=2715964 RepID=A0ABR7Z863_9PSED|nr:OmpA family protein [Pseudomonas typographi]MBD1554213.1 OmpA family protein [Pseudomonas typographi]MBD1586681.1 OmpA family protein [Pseudomonas typographi]MBD1601677.1 OmpA family protein [Pseudomonas typographi]
MGRLTKALLPVLLVSSVLSGCATHSDGSAPLNQRNWPICSVLGGAVGAGLGAIESGAWAAGGGLLGAIGGGLICYAQDGDEDGDGIFDRRDRCPGTPKGTPVSHNGCPLPQYPAAPPKAEPPPPPQEEVITLSDAGDVLFEFDKSNLTAEATAQLDKQLDKLRAADVVTIKVEGHTDSMGTDAYNQGLSERRAASVVRYLVAHGVQQSKISSQGFGESRPVADNSTDEGRAQNRRVELHINR